MAEVDAMSQRQNIPELDGLRGVAISLVFLTHFVALSIGPESTGFEHIVYSLSHLGWVGVDLFFVLSGFLITGILLDTKGQPHYWRNYAMRRLLRIFPLYYGVLVVAFVLGPLTHWQDPSYATLRANQAWYWLYATNFLQMIHGPDATPLNTSHFWSLSIEEQFYLFWPLVVLWVPQRKLVAVCAGTMAVGLVIRLVLVATMAPGAAYVFTPGRLDGLMVGAIIAVLARRELPWVQITDNLSIRSAGPGGFWSWDGTRVTTGTVYPALESFVPYAQFASVICVSLFGTGSV